MTVKLRPNADDPTVLEVIEDGARIGEIVLLRDRWHILDPWQPTTYATQQEAIEAVRRNPCNP